jgi:transposase InsO family protein
MCEWSIFLGVRRLKRRCAGITLLSHASTATREFDELARNNNRGVAANVLDRAFEAATPNRKWIADFTYVWTIDLFFQ